MHDSPYRTLRTIIVLVLVAAAPLLWMAGAAAAKALTPRSAVPAAARALPPLVGGGGWYRGLGFDTCAAPSADQMAAWGASPYSAIGIYVGGSNRSCSQPNLTAGWVRDQLAAGWALVPTYVGPQAPGNTCGCASIVPSRAGAEGAAAAADAVAELRALGIGRGSPVYYDMEAYPVGGAASRAVVAFLGAWTARLHAAGYRSGVYGSAESAVADLAAHRGGGYPEPDDVWIAHWNGRATTSEADLPARDWAHHQRLHQYSGLRSESYGGVSLTVDDDMLDGEVVFAGGGAGAPN